MSGAEQNQIFDERIAAGKAAGFLGSNNKLQQGTSKISETKSATDQLAAIFTFMKVLDPTSVVREGEQESAKNRRSNRSIHWIYQPD